MELGVAIEEDVALARFTTLGTGGPARYFARPETIDELQDVLRWAASQGVEVEVIGLGSNVLVHDDGVDGLVLKLAGALAQVRVEGDELVAGGGTPNAVCLHRARAAGLGGFEFASAIPGTAGGGVRMNAGAYGSDWRAVMVDAVVVDADGPRTVTADDLDLSYRHSNLAAGDATSADAGALMAEVRRRVKEQFGVELEHEVRLLGPIELPPA